MLATGGYLIFPDSPSYIREGKSIWNLALDVLGLSGDQGGAAIVSEAGGTDGSAAGTSPAGDDRSEPRFVRSFIYSFYTFLAGSAVWPAGFALLQAAMTLLMLFALIGPAEAARPRVLAAGFVYLAAFTTLPWFASFLMPDILTAAVVIHAAILMRRIDEMTIWERMPIIAIAAFAVSAHYGNGPLAAGLFGLVLLWRLLARRLTLTVMVAAALPVLFAPLANLGGSSVALDKPSVAPLRLPILLARSIQDGPARWYLQEACPEAPLAFCEIYGDEVPATTQAFLWDEGGINSLSSQQIARIREEEFDILAGAFLAYPVQQTISLFRNAALQTVKIGTDEVLIGERRGDVVAQIKPERGVRVVETFDEIVSVTTWAAGLVVLWLLLRGRLARHQLEILAAVAAGWLLNALIFGGLSAPVDRYQARIAWLLPALAAIFLAGRAQRLAPGAFGESAGRRA